MWDLVWKVFCAGFLKFFTPEFTAGLPKRLLYATNSPQGQSCSSTISELTQQQGSTVRIMFFDFSNAFNTIQPHLLVQKLLNMKIPSLLRSVISWIFDYLTSRLQYVRLNGFLSSAIRTTTGAPQGTVLAPFLFALYIPDCRSTDESCPVVKFADDTELVGKMSNDEDAIYHKQTENFVN